MNPELKGETWRYTFRNYYTTGDIEGHESK